MIVRLSVSPSPNYRTRSQKTLGPGSAGPWKVQVYDSTNLSPLGEMAAHSESGGFFQHQFTELIRFCLGAKHGALVTDGLAPIGIRQIGVESAVVVPRQFALE